MSDVRDIAVEYAGADVAVRNDLRDSHRALLDALRRPGAWFTGAERTAIELDLARFASSANSPGL